MLTIYSNRGAMNSVDLSIPFESFLMRLFGVRMEHKHGRKDEKTWKAYLSKIIGAIDKSIHNSLSSDGFHVFRLESHISRIKEALKSKEVVDPEIILHLSSIIFELLGRVPDHRGRTVVNRRDDYTLRYLRTLQYTQSKYQRVATILAASKWKPYSDMHKYDDLEDKYFIDCAHDPDAFIIWYKKRYPDGYLRLF